MANLLVVASETTIVSDSPIVETILLISKTETTNMSSTVVTIKVISRQIGLITETTAIAETNPISVLPFRISVGDVVPVADEPSFYRKIPATWDFRIPVTVLATQVSGAAAMGDFPVYLDLSLLPAQFFQNVKSDGSDIRIYAADGVTQLPCEVVSIDVNAMTGEIWFAGTVSPLADTIFQLWYGNPTAVAHQPTALFGAYRVWSKSKAQMVHHMTSQSDSSGAGYTLTPTNNPAQVAGKVGTAYALVNANQSYLAVPTVGSSQPVLQTAQSLTMSSWANLQLNTGGVNLMIKPYGSSNGARTGFNFDPATGTITFSVCTGGNTNRSAQIFSPSSYGVGSWHHIVGTWDKTNGSMKLYIDGQLVASRADGPIIVAGGTDNLFYGTEQNTGVPGYMNVLVDEGEVYSTPQSADFIATTYNNQNSPATFFSIGSFAYNSTDITPMTDSSSLVIADPFSVSETTPISESVSMRLFSFVNKTETTVMSETSSADIQVKINKTDTTVMSETLVIEDFEQGVVITESVPVLDQPTIHLRTFISVSETTPVTATFNGGVHFIVSAFDGTLRLGFRFASYSLIGEPKTSILSRAQDKTYVLKL